MAYERRQKLRAIFSTSLIRLVALAAACIAIASSIPRAAAYDPLDPTGNVTIVWDVTSFTGDGYLASVRMYNYQQFRKISLPGWQLNWNWTNGEYIWSMTGAEAAKQGDCSKTTYPGGKVPHCCLQYPVIVDLLPFKDGPGPYLNCCKAGVLGSWAQDTEDYLSAFQITVGNASNTVWSYKPPQNFSMGVDGYTCTAPKAVNATVYYAVQSRRATQALLTHEIVCTYSRKEVRKLPKCCVSLSAFYNETIIPCNSCGCACGNYTTKSTICTDAGDEVPYLMSTASGDGMELKTKQGSMLCSPDGCPISVHYHVKLNYQAYWRAKVTVINRSLWTNHTSWNLVLEHPNFRNFTEAFSFHMKSIQPFGVNNTAVFWGLPDYNDILMPAGQGGNVQSELLFAKNEEFTLSNGWAFPRKVIFNGEECVMPHEFPFLPSPASHTIPSLVVVVAVALLSTLLMLLC